MLKWNRLIPSYFTLKFIFFTAITFQPTIGEYKLLSYLFLAIGLQTQQTSLHSHYIYTGHKTTDVAVVAPGQNDRGVYGSSHHNQTFIHIYMRPC